MDEIKKKWLSAALEYVLENGLAGVSLRPMAEVLGTSPRMLLYHFHSKEGLLRAILSELSLRLETSYSRMTAADSGGSGRIPPLKRFWLWAIRNENLPYWRLHYEFHILAVRNPQEYGRYRQEARVQWQALALKALADRARATPLAMPVATLGAAVFDGLMLELISTGDAERLTSALDHFIGLASKKIGVDRSA